MRRLREPMCWWRMLAPPHRLATANLLCAPVRTEGVMGRRRMHRMTELPARLKGAPATCLRCYASSARQARSDRAWAARNALLAAVSALLLGGCAVVDHFRASPAGPTPD